VAIGDTSHVNFEYSRMLHACLIAVSITGPVYGGFILEARDTNGQGVGMFDSTNLPAGSQAGPCMSKYVFLSHMTIACLLLVGVI